MNEAKQVSRPGFDLADHYAPARWARSKHGWTFEDGKRDPVRFQHRLCGRLLAVGCWTPTDWRRIACEGVAI
jgi:hypothetical protein